MPKNDMIFVYNIICKSGIFFGRRLASKCLWESAFKFLSSHVVHYNFDGHFIYMYGICTGRISERQSFAKRLEFITYLCQLGWHITMTGLAGVNEGQMWLKSVFSLNMSGRLCYPTLGGHTSTSTGCYKAH